MPLFLSVKMEKKKCFCMCLINFEFSIWLHYVYEKGGTGPLRLLFLERTCSHAEGELNPPFCVKVLE